MKKISKILIFTLIIFIFFFLFGGKKILRVFYDTKNDSQYFSLVSEISDLIKTRYVEYVDPDSKFPGAFSSMLHSLDEFSAYLSHIHSKKYKIFNHGSPFCCGIYGRMEKNYFYITDVVLESPANKAGLEYGDVIQGINGKSIASLSFWEVFLSFFSEKSEQVDLVIKKRNSNSIIEISLYTEKLFTSLSTRKIAEDIFFITLFRIDFQSVYLLQEIMKKNPLNKYIIDLRKYSGGNFDSFLALTKLLINKKIPLVLKTKNGTEQFWVGSDTSPQYKGLFIIGSSTILYSELIAFLLRSTNKILVGKQTLGFMPHLRQFFLSDGSSVLIPSGFFRFQNMELSRIVVKPHFEVKDSQSETLIKYCLNLLKDI